MRFYSIISLRGKILFFDIVCKIKIHVPFVHLQLFGDGSIAQAILSGQADHGHELTINIGWAVGVTMGAYVAIGITGGHMNPAVTLAMAVRGRTSWFKVRLPSVRE